MPENNKIRDLFLIFKNEKDLVFFISRSQSFNEGKRIRKELLIKAIEEKYGKPTKILANGELIWEFDKNGNLNLKEKCYFFVNEENVVGMELKITIPDAKAVNPDGENGNCVSRRYYLHMHEGREAPEMIDEYNIQLIDVNLMLEKHRRFEIENQEFIEQEAKKENKPKL